MKKQAIFIVPRPKFMYTMRLKLSINKSVLVCILRMLCIVLFFAMGTDLAFGQLPAAPYLVSPDAEEKLKLAFIPENIPLYLYPNAPLAQDIDTKRLREELYRFAKEYPYTNPMTFLLVKQRIQTESAQRASAFAQAVIDIGYARTHLANQNLDAAITLLHRIIDNHTSALTFAHEPLAVAEAEQYLAYALLDKVRANPELEASYREQIRAAFLEMVRYAPHVVLWEGRQPADRVAVYNEARQLFLDNEALRRVKQSDASALAQVISADIIVSPRLVQNAQGALLFEIDIYETSTKSMKHYQTTLHFHANESDAKLLWLQELQSLLALGFACLKPHEKPEMLGYKNQAKRFYLELGFAQSWFLEFPTSSVFTNLGASVKLSYMFNDYVFIFGNFIITHSLQDISKDLVENFNHLRFVIAGGLSKQFRYARPFFAFGVELSYTSPFRTSRSAACKTFGINDWECLPGEVKYHKLDPHAGFSVYAGTDIGAEPFFVVLEFVFAAYVLPIEGKILNFASSYHVSLQYRF